MSYPTLNINRAHAALTAWFTQNARDLPWRDKHVSAWGVLVSEVMLQQTQVSRVAPIWIQWMNDWPTPADFAQVPLAEVLHAWGRLGYPRRAKRLHEAARVIAEQFDGIVPNTEATLRSLPGIGEYTAAAVCCFAHGQPTVVVDTNIRRTLVRHFVGEPYAAPSYSATERSLAQSICSDLDASAVPGWNIAVMELGALVCGAKQAACDICPLERTCAWRSRREPLPPPITSRVAQPFSQTHRYARGLVMDSLRQNPTRTVNITALQLDISPSRQQRAIATLLADGLIWQRGDVIGLGASSEPTLQA